MLFYIAVDFRLLTKGQSICVDDGNQFVAILCHELGHVTFENPKRLLENYMIVKISNQIFLVLIRNICIGTNLVFHNMGWFLKYQLERRRFPDMVELNNKSEELFTAMNAGKADEFFKTWDGIKTYSPLNLGALDLRKSSIISAIDFRYFNS